MMAVYFFLKKILKYHNFFLNIMRFFNDVLGLKKFPDICIWAYPLCEFQAMVQILFLVA